MQNFPDNLCSWGAVPKLGVLGGVKPTTSERGRTWNASNALIGHAIETLMFLAAEHTATSQCVSGHSTKCS